MTNSTNPELDEIFRLVGIAARAADEKLGFRTVVLDVSELLVITDAFLITSAKSDRQVRAIAENVEKELKLAGGSSPIRIEGLDEATWVLMDFGDFVVHIFDEITREYYDLEHLWQHAPRVEWASETQGRVSETKNTSAEDEAAKSAAAENEAAAQ